MDLENDGYFTLDLDSARAQADWNYVSTIYDTNYTLSLGGPWYVKCDERHLQQGSTHATGFVNSAPFAPWEINNSPHVGLEELLPTHQFLLRKIYPNPFENEVTVEFYLDSPQELTFQLVDLQGKLVWERRLMTHTGEQKIGLEFPSDLEKNAWLLLVREGEKVYAEKLLKAR
ncbi:MAG: T9SS type A sorting domain-containing protein [Bacteroidia bacterium]|nr:T9SS type A sorting domain-containing protein [Bacteroidia bacterium]